MFQKYKILIITCLVLLVAVIIGGGFWYFNKNKNGNSQEKEIAFSTGFTLLDDEKSLLWSEVVQLDPEVRANFEKKLKKLS